MDIEFNSLVFEHYSFDLPENSEISGEFERSPEFSVLWHKLYNQDHSKPKNLLKVAKKIVDPSFVTDCNRISIIDKRCIGLKCLLNRSFTKSYTVDKLLVVSFSLIAPVCFIEVLEVNHLEGILINDPKIIDGDFYENLLTLSEKIRTFGFDRIEKDVYQKRIGQITFPRVNLVISTLSLPILCLICYIKLIWTEWETCSRIDSDYTLLYTTTVHSPSPKK